VPWNSHRHQKEKHSMKYYAGLDVSVKETSVCIVDEAGKICREVKVASHPEDLVQVLKDPAWQLFRVESRTSVAMAVQWFGGGRIAGDLY
jgi:transposase